MKKPLIGIVIVNYNGAKFQNSCIASILDSSYQNFRIIIIDNASKDNSMKLLDVFNDERIIKIYEKENLGVATGNNIGVKKSIELGCDYSLLLNNDTEIEPDTIKKIVDKAKDNLVVVPKIYFYKGQNIWYAGGHFLWKRAGNVHDHYAEKDDGSIEFKDFYDYAPTCCMLINNIIFKMVGFFDDNYFLYYDDTDFCMRLYTNGIHIAFAKDAIVYHKVSMSTGGSESKVSIYYGNRNRLYFREKFKHVFSLSALLYLKGSYFAKHLLGVIKRDNRRYIRKASKDYKAGRMGRCDNL